MNDIIGKRIDNAYEALNRCKDKDMKKYWNRVIKILCRRMRKEKVIH